MDQIAASLFPWQSGRWCKFLIAFLFLGFVYFFPSPCSSQPPELSDEQCAIEARKFAELCYASDEVFIGWRGISKMDWTLSPAERYEFVKQLSTNGTMLDMYDHYSPEKLRTIRNGRLHGLKRTWYRNGRVRSDEIHDNGRLMQGSYYDSSGILLSRITNGYGVKPDNFGEKKAEISGIVQFANGLQHGMSRCKRSDCLSVEIYWNGNQQGIQRYYSHSGSLIREEEYRKDQEPGAEITWDHTWRTWDPEGRLDHLGIHLPGSRPSWISLNYYSNNWIKGIETDNWLFYWHPNGVLMSETEHFKRNFRVINARSFDVCGNQNGEIRNGKGQIVRSEWGSSMTQYTLLVLDPKSVHKRSEFQLPNLKINPDFVIETQSVSLNLELQFPINREPVEMSGTISVELPDGMHAHGPSSFPFLQTSEMELIVLGSTEIQFSNLPLKSIDEICFRTDIIVNGFQTFYRTLWKPDGRFTHDGN